jgi:hypothetical protein
LDGLRSKFDEVFDTRIIGGGFFESDEYYRIQRERYWRSLMFFCRLDLPRPARVLEIGGGQLALLCKELFDDDVVVGDVSERFSAPIRNVGIKTVVLNLAHPDHMEAGGPYDAVVMLEVIEHVPVPAHVVMESIKPLLSQNGVVFMTTRNLFRLRNLIRMFLGIEFLDRFTVATPGKNLGHQLEYSADHLKWQLEQAGLQVVMLLHDGLGGEGHSFGARLARKILKPLDLRPKWRDGLVIAGRKP